MAKAAQTTTQKLNRKSSDALESPQNTTVAPHLLLVPPVVAESVARAHRLDALRGVAVLLMMIYHFLFDLRTSFPKTKILGATIESWSPNVWYFGSGFIGLLFYFVAGVSVHYLVNGSGVQVAQRVLFKKGIKLGVVAAAISLVTFQFDRTLFISFGTIHCLALSLFLMQYFLEWKKEAIWIGIALGLGFWALSTVDFPFTWATWLGLLSSQANYGGDYFPLMPWLGVVLIGFGLGTAWQDKVEKTNQAHVGNPLRGQGLLNFLGVHALSIYLIHQPVLVIGFEMVKRF